MSASVEQFPFVERESKLGAASLALMLPFTLAASKSVALSGLVDTGAAVNVLPYTVGLSLGFDWDQQTTAIELSGNLARVEARVAVASATIGSFGPVRMAFAWTREDAVPVILGQVNLSMEFDVCFFRTRRVFELRRAQRA